MEKIPKQRYKTYNNLSKNDFLNSNSLLNTMYSDSNTNFFISTKFQNLQEHQELKLKREALDQKIKFRKDFENTYNSLKLNELEKNIEDIKFKNSIAIKRNQDLLNSLQTDILKCHQISKISQNSKKI